MEGVTLTYYGHSCFCLEYGGYRTVLDPYGDGSVPGLPDLRLTAEAVYCSHGHGDHSNAAAVTLTGKTPPPYTLTELTVPHDGAGGKQRGMNTVRLFDFSGLRVAHMGDLGRVLTEKEAAALAGVDCLLLPVGGYFTVDALQAKAVMEQVRPRITVPMHYRTAASGYDVIAPLEDFTRLFPQVTVCGHTMELTKETPAGVWVLTSQGKEEKDETV